MGVWGGLSSGNQDDKIYQPSPGSQATAPCSNGRMLRRTAGLGLCLPLVLGLFPAALHITITRTTPKPTVHARGITQVYRVERASVIVEAPQVIPMGRQVCKPLI